ncbi:MAG: UDP-N-acetylmuramyl-tripeptide synthetase [Candidatus Kaiserbacteria bacterium]|nr:UDP-N-acetylmuramyl-tripeptide synthetase [Candidatus Kaiserbacteria bacterium]
MSGIKKAIRAIVPAPLLSAYHFLLAYIGSALYGFPSRKMIVIGVTGTDGKSSTTEYINAIFEAAGHHTAVSNSIRIKVNNETGVATGRSMPGRFFIQRFMRRALRAGCTVAIIEMTSEGVRQHRHRAIALDALVFTNLSPEHIESHGSFEAYADAKYQIGQVLARSPKRPRAIIANADDAQGPRYLALPVEKKYGFSLSNNAPYSTDTHGGYFTYGERIDVALPGEFSLKNALAAACVASAFNIDRAAIRAGVAAVKHIPGRLQEIKAGQDFAVVVDYALTPDALEALYTTYGTQKKICVFGSAGGGRDIWKRPVLGKIAEKYCDSVILTNDIAYDEDPAKIINDIAGGMSTTPEIIPDRRAAIRRSLEIARTNNDPNTVVLISGMGIDSEITSAEGAKISWSDVDVTQEELSRLLKRV